MFLLRPALPFLVLTPAIVQTANVPTTAGRVLDPNGKPVAGATIIISRFTDEGKLQESPVQKTSADGAFLLPWDQGSVRVQVIAYAPGYAPTGAILIDRPGAAPPRTCELRLAPGTELRGVVEDKSGKPVAGAMVQLIYLFPTADPQDSRFIFIPASLQKQFSATTGADGTWRIKGVPPVGQAVVALSGSRFVIITARTTLTKEGAVSLPLVARVGGTIIGRALFADGTPAIGARITAQNSDAHSATGIANEKGVYRIEGLPNGSFNIYVDAPPPSQPETVAVAAEGIRVVEGKESVAPNLTFTPGAVIEGTITDAETGAPVADTYVVSTGPHRPAYNGRLMGITTDSQGKYRLRVAPGDNGVGIGLVPAGYQQDSNPVNLNIRQGQTLTQNFRLRRGAALAGLCVDETGKPVAGARLQVLSHDMGASLETDIDGKWHIASLDPAHPVVVTVLSEEWSLDAATSSLSVKVPAATPVIVKLKRNALLSLTGRIIDDRGKPVAGASVEARVSPPSGASSTDVRILKAATAAEGGFTFPNVPPEGSVTLTARHPGYRFKGGGKVEKISDTSLSASDLVLVALTQRLTGRVTDSKGKPVVDAHVLSPAGEPAAETTTDAKGMFSLKALPDTEVDVFAASGNLWGQGRFRPGPTPVSLILEPLPSPSAKSDLPRAYALLQTLKKETTSNDYYARSSALLELLPYDTDLNWTLKLAAEPDGSLSPGVVQGILGGLMKRRDWPRAIAFGQARLSSMSDATVRRFILVQVGKALAYQGRQAEAVAMYQRLKADIGQDAAPGVLETLSLIALAAPLRNGDAEALAARLIETEKKRQREDNFEPGLGEAICAMLTAGDPQAVARILPFLPEKVRIRALKEAVISACAQSPATARALLERLGTLPDNADKEKEGAYAIAAKAVIEALGKSSDPAGALTLARTVEFDAKAEAMAIAAVYQKDPLLRASVYREALSAVPSMYLSNVHKARIAAQAYDADPKLGANLFAEVGDILSAARPDEGRSGEIIGYAFYLARHRPAESRLLLETELVRTQQAGGASNQESSQQIAAIARAMAAVDGERALDIVSLIPQDSKTNSLRWDTRRKIAQYLAAPPSLRRAIPFDRWGASDSWQPGEATRW